MKAVVLTKDALPCVVYWTGRVRLHVEVTTWCGEKRDGADGVVQIPESAEVCAGCEERLKIGRPLVTKTPT